MQSPRESLWSIASAALVALVLCAGRVVPAVAQEEPAQAWGTLLVQPGEAEAGREALRTLSAALAWWGMEGEPGGEGLVEYLESPPQEGPGKRWRLVASGDGSLGLSAPVPAQDQLPATVTLDLLADLNGLRRLSEHPFSRSRRGRALDALGLDNARRARISLLDASPDPGPLTLALFSESRAEPPGRWHAIPLGAVSLGPESRPRALHVDLSKQWEGLVLSAADLALGLSSSSDASSTAERLSRWGSARVDALRSIAGATDGRAWVWRTEGGLCAAFPLQHGQSDRTLAPKLRAVLGRRLEWHRADAAPPTGSVGLTVNDRPPAQGDRTLALRFITIRGRSALVVATESAALEGAPAVLADLSQEGR